MLSCQLNTIAILAFFDLQGSDTSYKDNWATYSADKVKSTIKRPGYVFFNSTMNEN